jgi:hypothetical protein
MQDMKDVTNRWLSRNAKGKGVVACGILYSDQTTTSFSESAQFPTEALENSWVSLANAFDFLRQNQKSGEQMRWVFENFYLHGAIRADNACLGIFTSKTEEEYDAAVVNRMIAEFKGILGSEKR